MQVQFLISTPNTVFVTPCSLKASDLQHFFTSLHSSNSTNQCNMILDSNATDNLHNNSAHRHESSNINTTHYTEGNKENKNNNSSRTIGSHNPDDTDTYHNNTD